MKISKLVVILNIILILLSGCGYKVLNQIGTTKITSYELLGDEKINKKLRNNFDRLADIEDYKKEIKVKASTELIKKVTSKDSAGKELSYSLKIIVKLKILKKNDNLYGNQIIFEKDTNYNNLNSKFELKQYESIQLNDLLNQLILDINSFINNAG